MNNHDDEEAQLMRVIADVIEEDEVEESSRVNYAKEHFEKSNNSLKELLLPNYAFQDSPGVI
jgi:1,4-dihydroxy-2-naphthoyl-CoA synthase